MEQGKVWSHHTGYARCCGSSVCVFVRDRCNQHGPGPVWTCVSNKERQKDECKMRVLAFVEHNTSSVWLCGSIAESDQQ